MKPKTKLSLLSAAIVAIILIISLCVHIHNKRVEDATRAVLEWETELTLPSSFNDLRIYLTNHQFDTSSQMFYSVDIMNVENEGKSYKETRLWKKLKEESMASRANKNKR